MPDLFPILIPSKGRPNGATMRLLNQEGIPFTLYVEPQDEALYRRAGWETLSLLAANNQGVAFTRRAILAEAASDWLWMLDDDLTAFYRTAQGRCLPTTAREALIGAQEILQANSRIALGALEFRQFAWSAKQPCVLGGYCLACVAVHVRRIAPVTYRPGLRFKEDHDFALQVLSLGYLTCRVTAWSFSTPKPGQNPGGLHAAYQEANIALNSSQALARLWPGICTLRRKRDGTVDVAINWKYFQQGLPHAD